VLVNAAHVKQVPGRKTGDRGRDSGHRRRDIPEECARRQAELSRIEGAGRNGDTPDGYAAL